MKGAQVHLVDRVIELGAHLAELARRNLIRPITTQGHIGDVLPDKIVYAASAGRTSASPSVSPWR